MGLVRNVVQAEPVPAPDCAIWPEPSADSVIGAGVVAKIAVWHLKDPDVRDPAKWIGKAKDYLRRAGSFEEFHN